MEGAKVSAVILDLDGTLLDTERATGHVLRDFLAKYGKVPDVEKEEKRLGKTHKESAAAVVVDYDLPMTPEEFSEAIMPLYQQKWPQAKALPGVNRLMTHLHSHGVPLALASNSIRKHIEIKISHQQGWRELFSVIIGGDEVTHGKPSPDIFLEAANRLGIEISNCLVVEDSLVGVRAGKAAGAKVVAVPCLLNQDEQYSIANCILHSLIEFQPELWGLPAFEDWIQNALPIEPLYIGGLIVEGAHQGGCVVLNIIAEDGSFTSLSSQVSGVFFGWAKLQTQGIFKMVASVGWKFSSGFAKRVIQPRLFGDVDKIASKKQIDMVFVGYIRKLHDEADIMEALKLSKEDESVAQSALDEPVFSVCSSRYFGDEE